MVGAVDDEGVGVGDVQATLDNAGAHQHIYVACCELQHGPFQLPFSHLPVSDDKIGLGHQLLQSPGNLIDAHHPIMDKVHLPTAVYFAQNGLADERLIILTHLGAYRQTLLRRGIDSAHVAHTAQGHV